MKRFFAAFLVLALGAWLFCGSSAQAYAQHFWRVTSPDHEQTFTYGTEQSRVWAEWGRDKHLAVILDFTNDPYVSRDNPRQYDHFTFSFPGVTLGKDGQTFYYHASDGRSIPVARKHSGFLGITEIRLLPNANLIVNKPHGYLTLILEIEG